MKEIQISKANDKILADVVAIKIKKQLKQKENYVQDLINKVEKIQFRWNIKNQCGVIGEKLRNAKKKGNPRYKPVRVRGKDDVIRKVYKLRKRK